MKPTLHILIVTAALAFLISSCSNSDSTMRSTNAGVGTPSGRTRGDFNSVNAEPSSR